MLTLRGPRVRFSIGGAGALATFWVVQVLALLYMLLATFWVRPGDLL